jgi:hypothetical protein
MGLVEQQKLRLGEQSRERVGEVVPETLQSL